MADILPPAPVDAPFGSYNWVDWYKKVRDQINQANNLTWASITGKPTTVAGYAISDAVKTAGGKLTTQATLGNGSAGGFATITNAPRSGNPSKWIPLDDNGTTYYIPVW